MFKILVGTIAFGALAMRATHAFELERWFVTVCLLVLAVVLYMINNRLIVHYIRSRAPEFANAGDWELTAGLGIVPQWVSWIGLLSISALLAAAIPWIVLFFR